MNLTPWYPGNVRPVRAGLYRRAASVATRRSSPRFKHDKASRCHRADTRMTFCADGVFSSTAGLQPAGAGVTPSSALQFWVSSKSIAAFLAANHYLGPVARGFACSDEWGVLVLAKPTARRLPQDGTWLELVRWCLVGARNGGS